MIKQSWWLVLFALVCYMFYERQMSHRDAQFFILNNILAELKEKKRVVSSEHDELLLQVKSQEDPAWVELVLMRRLGLVPEGYIKVYTYLK